MAVAAALFAASRAFNDDGGDGEPLASDATPTPEFMTKVTREREGVTLEVSVNKEEYESGDQVEVRATVSNGREDAITYASPTGEPITGFLIISELAGAQPLATEGQPPPASGTMEPGDDFGLQSTWDQVIDIYQDPVQAPPGRYSIEAGFTATLAGRAEPVELKAAVTFEVVGSESIIDPNSALTIALGTQELKDWMAGRADNVVCAYSPRGSFFNGSVSGGSSSETFEEVYSGQLTSGLPLCSIVTEGDDWRLLFLSSAGGDPHRISIFIDLHTGAFERYQEDVVQATFAPTPAPTP